MEISSIRKAITDTNANTSSRVCAARSSKSRSARSAHRRRSGRRPPPEPSAAWHAASRRVARLHLLGVHRQHRRAARCLVVVAEHRRGDRHDVDGLSGRLPTASSFGALDALLASGLGNETRMRTGPSAPGPRASAAAATPPRISWEDGNCRCMLLPSTMPNDGAARRSRNAAADSADTHDRRITMPTHRVQNRDWWPPLGATSAAAGSVAPPPARTARAPPGSGSPR